MRDDTPEAFDAVTFDTDSLRPPAEAPPDAPIAAAFQAIVDAAGVEQYVAALVENDAPEGVEEATG